MPEGPDARKLTVAAAALAYGLPERSLFRAVEKHRIPSTKRDGVTVVDLADVESWSARRLAAQSSPVPATATAGQTAATAAAMAGSLPAGHGGVAVGSGRTALRAIDGEATARFIARFKRGEDVVDAAEAERFPIPPVLEVFEQYQRAKSAAAPPPFQVKLDELQMVIEVATADIAGLMNAITELRGSIAAIEARIASMPIPDRAKFTCKGCGATGFVATDVSCTSCGRPSKIGFYPTEP